MVLQMYRKTYRQKNKPSKQIDKQTQNCCLRISYIQRQVILSLLSQVDQAKLNILHNVTMRTVLRASKNFHGLCLYSVGNVRGERSHEVSFNRKEPVYKNWFN